MEPIKCFLLVPTEKEKQYLRRYNSYTNNPENCPLSGYYHNAETFIGIADETWDEEKKCWRDGGKTAEDFKGDSRWPTHCACGYEFKQTDEWQLFSQHLYKRTDTGEEMTLREAPEGAIWEADWYTGMRGADGRTFVCKVPKKHEWIIDGPCSNCTRVGEPHHCWVRHGEAPNFTVDKNGNTCSAGGGSILTKDWHGFLRNGYLVDC